MIDADGRLASVNAGDRVEDEVMVVNQGGNVVLLRCTDTIPAMVPEVVDDQLVVFGKQ